jgi:hypothetical protein
VTFSRAADVPAEKLAGLKQYIEELRPLMRAVEIQADDYNVEAAEADVAPPSGKEAF